MKQVIILVGKLSTEVTKEEENGNEGDSAVKAQAINYSSEYTSNFTTVIFTGWPS